MPKLATDPPVSEAQRRAMYAAAAGKSSLGIPQSVGKEFVAQDDRVKGAGIAFMTPKGKVLFLKRSPESNHPGEWDFPGGKADDNETPEETALREAGEEVGKFPDGELTFLAHEPDSDGVEFVTYLMPVPGKFKPELQEEEHTEWKWARLDDPPQPLHPGVAKVIRDVLQNHKTAGDARMAADNLAFDRGSLRTIDQDGRMHVELSNISKANICPYYGNEIPEWESLGLDPHKVYQLLRDPEELAKGAASFNNIPLIDAYSQTGQEHIPVSAMDPKKDLICGSTGTDAVFEAPYLKNSLVIWDAKTIKGVETEKRREISCAYYYDADMTPGTYQGTHYDGVMRNIRGNHVAIVAAGRAGPDVAVGDSQLEKRNMSKKLSLSKRAALAKGALLAAKPKLAADAKLDLNKILANVTAKNWAEQKPLVIAAIKPKLAADADIDALVELLDSLDGGEESAMDVEPDEVMSTDEDPLSAICEMLKGKLGDEDYAAVEPMLRGLKLAKDDDEPAMDDDEPSMDEPDDKKPAVAQDDPPAFAGKPETGVSVDKPNGENKKSAMDAAMVDARIKAAVKVAEDATIKRMREIADAEEFVKPYVGKLAIAQDSAESVYKVALKTMGIDTKGIHPSAFRAILEAQPKPGVQRETIAADSAMTGDILEAFPNATRLSKR